MKIRISYKKKVYYIEKEKIIFILEKMNGKEIQENEIMYYIKKYNLFDRYFLKNINKL